MLFKLPDSLGCQRSNEFQNSDNNIQLPLINTEEKSYSMKFEIVSSIGNDTSKTETTNGQAIVDQMDGTLMFSFSHDNDTRMVYDNSRAFLYRINDQTGSCDVSKLFNGYQLLNFSTPSNWSFPINFLFPDLDRQGYQYIGRVIYYI